MSIKIRPAQKNDAKFLAPLIYLAIDDVAEHFTGATSINQAIERLTILIAEDFNRFSYRYALIIEDDDKIIGICSAYPENMIDELTFKTLGLSRKYFWHIHKEIEERLLKDKEAPIGTYYIDHLAIASDYRGKGYATLLIDAMEKRARNSGYSIISLLVDIKNPNARFLYEKLGYYFSSDVLANGHHYTALIKKL